MSEADARHWLKLWAYPFSLDLKRVVAPHLDSLLRRATLRDYPNRAFTLINKRVDEAIYAAVEVYADRIGLEYRGDSCSEIERCRMVSYLLEQTGSKREAVCYSWITFLPENAPEHDEHNAETVYRIHITAGCRKITARILEPGEPTPPGVPRFDQPKKRGRKPLRRAPPNRDLPRSPPLQDNSLMPNSKIGRAESSRACWPIESGALLHDGYSRKYASARTSKK